MRLIITRPEDDALPLKAKLESRGHTAILAPLLKIVPRPDAYVPPLAYQLICTTSANALKCLQVEDRLKAIPLLAVGPQSLAVAREKGFTVPRPMVAMCMGLPPMPPQNLIPGKARFSIFQERKLRQICKPS